MQVHCPKCNEVLDPTQTFTHLGRCQGEPRPTAWPPAVLAAIRRQEMKDFQAMADRYFADRKAHTMGE